MKLNPDKIDGIFMPVADEAGSYVLRSTVDGDLLSFIRDAKQRAAFQLLTQMLGRAVQSTFEVHSVYEDLVVCYRMARRYPWKGTRIKKSQHLQFVWVQFLNLCYLFREKYKLAVNESNRCKKVFDKTGVVLPGPGLKEIDKAIGKFIRVRGQHFHEWFEHNKHIQLYSMLELINSVKQGSRFDDVEGHYRDAKMFLGWEIEEAGMFVESFLRGTFRDHINALSAMLKKFNGALDRLAREKVA